MSLSLRFAQILPGLAEALLIRLGRFERCDRSRLEQINVLSSDRPLDVLCRAEVPHHLKPQPPKCQNLL